MATVPTVGAGTSGGPAAARSLHDAATAKARGTPELRRAAEDFESVFIAQILHGLTAGLKGPGPFGNAEDDPYASMLQDQYARLISRSGGIGLADAVLGEMLKAQEAR